MWSYQYSDYNYIQHYGIKGMKWGIRRFQDKNGRLTKAGKERYGDSDGSEEKPKKFLDRFNLTEKQKKTIKIGAVVAGVAIAAYGGYRFYNSEAGKPIRDAVDNYLNNFDKKKPIYKQKKENRIAELKTRDVDTKYRFFKKKSLGTVEDDLLAVNEGQFGKLRGASNNCAFCTTAYELRRRGYDVRANYTDQGRVVDTASKFFKDANVISDLDYVQETYKTGSYPTKSGWIDHIKNRMLKEGEGARGNFCGTYERLYGGGGHSMIWEIVNNKVVFRDGQSGVTYDSVEDVLENFQVGGSNFWRTDNLEINTDTIYDAVSTLGKPRKNNPAMTSDPEYAKLIRNAIVQYKQFYGGTLEEAREQFRKQGYFS